MYFEGVAKPFAYFEAVLNPFVYFEAVLKPYLYFEVVLNFSLYVEGIPRPLLHFEGIPRPFTYFEAVPRPFPYFEGVSRPFLYFEVVRKRFLYFEGVPSSADKKPSFLLVFVFCERRYSGSFFCGERICITTALYWGARGGVFYRAKKTPSDLESFKTMERVKSIFSVLRRIKMGTKLDRAETS